MGCDIHFFVEKKVGDQWDCVYPPIIGYRDEEQERVDRRKDPEEKLRMQKLLDNFPGTMVDSYEEAKKIEGSWDEQFAHPLYVERNYSLFALLADVRNHGVVPISQPRGIPQDASEGYLWKSLSMGVDGHSHSYFTVQELLDVDWNQMVHHEGLVGPENYQLFKEKGAPEAWCGGVFGSPILSNEEMEDHIRKNPIKETGRTPWGLSNVYTSISWSTPAAWSIGEKFLKETLPHLQSMGDPNEVRVCFFFDN